MFTAGEWSPEGPPVTNVASQCLRPWGAECLSEIVQNLLLCQCAAIITCILHIHLRYLFRPFSRSQVAHVWTVFLLPGTFLDRLHSPQTGEPASIVARGLTH